MDDEGAFDGLTEDDLIDDAEVDTMVSPVQTCSIEWTVADISLSYMGGHTSRWTARERRVRICEPGFLLMCWVAPCVCCPTCMQSAIWYCYESKNLFVLRVVALGCTYVQW